MAPSTNRITLRLPKNTLEELKKEADEKDLPLSSLVIRILNKNVSFDRQFGSIKTILLSEVMFEEILDNMDQATIEKVAKMGPNQAWVRTNHKSGNITYPPTHTTSYSKVGVAADLDFNGNILYGTGSLVDHETGPVLYRKSTGIWIPSVACLFMVNGGNDYSQTFTQKCSETVVGTNKEYRVGATQKTSAYSVWSGPDTRADFWNGSYHSDIEQLRICDNGC